VVLDFQFKQSPVPLFHSFIGLTVFNFKLSGQVVPGPLVDFGILMFHCGQKLAAKGAGPFFYLR